MSPEDFQKKLRLLEQELVRIVKDAPFVKSQELLGLMLARIFNEGLDSRGVKIGDYKGGKAARYKALRNSLGLRIDTVDFEFSGELFRSVENGESEGKAVVGFTNARRAEIAGFLEEYYKKTVFPPTEKEQEAIQELMVDYIKDELRESIKKIFG